MFVCVSERGKERQMDRQGAVTKFPDRIQAYDVATYVYKGTILSGFFFYEEQHQLCFHLSAFMHH